MTGIVMTCLALMVAVVAAVGALRLRRRGSAIRPPTFTFPSMRGIAPRAPSLAQLCVLRT